MKSNFDLMKRNMMQKRFWIIVALILFSQAFLSPLAAPEAQARTQVTVTFAAGGVVCGIFIFLQFTVSSSLLPEDTYDTNALFNKGKEGWNVRIPSINMRQIQYPEAAHPTHVGEAVGMDLLKVRF
jgi:hypothetical protein